MAESRTRRVLARAWPYLLIAIAGLALLWPSPFAGPLRSADHVVHLARVQMWADSLSSGHLRGWSWAWFFGAPIGELYPPLGDMLVIAIKVLTLGLLSWAQAYAWAFWIVICLQGWILVALARRTGLGATTGAVAAAFALLDPGFTREGGWMYTVYFGVWPQVLSTSLCWLGLAFLIQAPAPAEDEGTQPTTAAPRRSNPRPGLAALAWGAAILAHPIALPVTVLSLLTWMTVGAPRQQYGPALARAAWVFVLGLGLAAWWLLPMLSHRAWMASYGWLFAPLSTLIDWLSDGRWAQRMPPAVGYAALVGAVWAVVRGPRPLRAIAILSIGLWLLAASDVFWRLRLDRLSEGFTHIQYQRFLIAAKPGVYLMAAWAVVGPLRAIWPTLRARQFSQLRSLAGAAALAATLLAGLATAHTVRAAREHGVGEVQMHRGAGALRIADADFAAAMDWLASRADASDEFWRVAYRANRNEHWFMDASQLSGLPVYKIGFTPGNNFVHKPEAGSKVLLDALRVRYMVRNRKGEATLRAQVARFGDLRIIERPIPGDNAGKHAGTGPVRVRVQGAGEVEALDQSNLHLQFRLVGQDAETRLHFDVAGHPDWHLRREGRELDWDEVPAFGDGAPVSTAAREAGHARGGRANGDTGAEAVLIGANAAGDGVYELRFAPAPTQIWGPLLLSLLSAVVLLITWRGAWPPAALALADKPTRALERLRPVHVGVALLSLSLLAGARWLSSKGREASTVLAWVDDAPGAKLGPIKTQMLIRPALLLSLTPQESTPVTLRRVPCGRPLAGWIAIDDDVGKQRRGASGRASYTLWRTSEPNQAAREGAATEPVRLASARHRPGQVAFKIPALQCEGESSLWLKAETNGEAERTLGVWLAAVEPDPASASAPGGEAAP